MNTNGPSEEKKKEWEQRAKLKNAIVPKYFEVFPDRVELICGKCGRAFKRALIMNLDEPTFVCPNDECRARNWIPLKFDLK